MRTKSQAASSRKFYLAHRAECIADKNARKQRNREFIREYKSARCCIRCGESTSCCLDFHHRNPSEKFSVVSVMAHHGFGIERIKAEIAKCDLLCANCHRKVTYGVVA